MPLDLSNQNLAGPLFLPYRGADLRGVILIGAHLEGADLHGLVLRGADLRGADLEAANLEGAHLEGADLRGAYLSGANFEGAHLNNANLSDLRGAHLENAHLEGAHLEGRHLERAHLEGARLDYADLRGAHLEDAYLFAAHLEGADLRGAHLEGAHLEGAHLEGAHLEIADLRGAHLENANLRGAYLSGANFEGATGLIQQPPTLVINHPQGLPPLGQPQSPLDSPQTPEGPPPLGQPQTPPGPPPLGPPPPGPPPPGPPLTINNWFENQGINTYQSIQPVPLTDTEHASVIIEPTTTVYDPIMMDDVNVYDYLKEDTDNIVICYLTNLHLVSKTRLRTLCSDSSAVKYNCFAVDRINFDRTTPYLTGRSFGCLCGLIEMSKIKTIIETPEIRVVQILDFIPEKNALSTISQTALLVNLKQNAAQLSNEERAIVNASNWVSVSHCQAGQEEKIRDIQKLPTPVFSTGGKLKRRNTVKKTKNKKTKKQKNKKTKKQKTKKL